MSVVPTALPSARGGRGSVNILGHQVSTDALVLAGASLVAVLLLYRAGKPASSAQQPLSLSGDGSSLVAPSNAMISSAPPAASTAPVVSASWPSTQLFHSGAPLPDVGVFYGPRVRTPV